MKTARRLLAGAAGRLDKAGCGSPRLDAEILLMQAWKIDTTQLIIRMDDTPDEDTNRSFQTMVKRRQRREPIAYILGEKEFWSRCFHVTPDTLIPRPETEHLIEAVLEQYPNHNKPYRFCDIGTGSGCLAVTLACEYPNAVIVATDVSGTVLSVAQENAELYGAADRTVFCQGDLFDALLLVDEPFDAIVSNPPYVSLDEIRELEPELKYEPYHALTDEADGLHYLRRLVKETPLHLKPAGRLIVETGLCGLPEETGDMRLEQKIFDLAGMLRGGVYRKSA